MTKINLDALAEVVRQMPRPPCDSCLWSRECTDPDACTPFRFYVDTGREIAPPRALPSGEHGG